MVNACWFPRFWCGVRMDFIYFFFCHVKPCEAFVQTSHVPQLSSRQNPCCKEWITNFNAATDITGYNDVCLHFSTVRRLSTQTCVRWKTARSVTGSRAVSSASIAATRTSVACNGCALVIRTSSTSWTASVAPSACQTISKKSKRKTTNIHANVETGRFMRQKWLVGRSGLTCISTSE